MNDWILNEVIKEEEYKYVLHVIGNDIQLSARAQFKHVLVMMLVLNLQFML